MPEFGVKPSPDEELVRLAQQGDERAFADLVRTHQNNVYTLAIRLVGDAALAADVAQEAFIRAWKALPQFRREAAFSTWLHRICVNTARTLQSRARKRMTLPLPDDAEIEAAGPGPEEAGERAEMRADLGRELMKLPRSQREAVVLKDVYGWTHADVADALGITVTAAKVRLHRGRKRLRDRLWESS